MIPDIKNSQNFLHNKQLVQHLVEISNLTTEDLVYEIGPGKGIITESLSGHFKQLVAVEYDKDLYQKLSSKYENIGNVQIINENFLDIELPKEKYKVFSNIPFNLTADILSKLLTGLNTPEDCYLVMQYEAVLRYGGKPYCNDSYKSLLFKPIYSVEIVYNFEPTDFYPIPSVDIVFVHFHKKEFCDIKKAPIINYWDFLSYIYMSSGQNFKEKTNKIFSYEQQKRLKKSLLINDEDYISDWDYAQWLGLFNFYNSMVSQDKKSLVKGSYQKMLEQQSKLEKIHRNRNI